MSFENQEENDYINILETIAKTNDPEHELQWKFIDNLYQLQKLYNETKEWTPLVNTEFFEKLFENNGFTKKKKEKTIWDNTH